MQNDLLDKDGLSNKKATGIWFRPLAILIEAIAGVGFIVGMISKNPGIVTIGISTAALIYLVFSWYIFRTRKFKILNLIFALILGLLLFSSIIGFAFYRNEWEGAVEMILVTHQLLIVGFGLSFVRLIRRPGDKNEFTMSYKLLSRFLILMLVFYSLGLQEYTHELLSR